jgi:hypothetical protein
VYGTYNDQGITVALNIHDLYPWSCAENALFGCAAQCSG